MLSKNCLKYPTNQNVSDLVQDEARILLRQLLDTVIQALWYFYYLGIFDPKE